MRKCGKKLPFFMMYRYPEKLNRYFSIQNKNRKREAGTLKIESNAYHSPSPMNELCDYICTWEKKKIQWDNSCVNTSYLILDNSLKLDDKDIIKQVRHVLNGIANEWRCAIERKEKGEPVDINALLLQYEDRLKKIVPNRTLLANYCVKIVYSNISTNKSIVWALFSDVILSNIRKNTPQSKHIKIIETTPYNPNAYEYLGKYYEVVEGVADV